MHPATLCGVGVITKLYFYFSGIKGILNLGQRSFKVIRFVGNRKPVYRGTIYGTLIVTFALPLTVSGILRFYTPRANCVSK